MDGPLELLLVLVGGMAAGMINTIVGSGTLVTFPTLLAIGLPPVTANVSNTIGIAPGNMSGAWGYRRELRGQRAELYWLGPASLLGAVVGAVLLLVLPSSAFDAIVPVLIGLGVLLVIIGPAVNRRLRRRMPTDNRRQVWLWPAVFATAIYGGYFGAAQGVLLMAILGIGLGGDIQRQNALKNVLASMVNLLAALIFVVVADIDWPVVGVLAVGSMIGGQFGASVGRRLPPSVLRTVIVVVGVIAIVAFVR